jgi:HTH-type transcriptional repressor of NAD biosynthesis genes
VSRALVIGKFWPPHLGHLHLFETAERHADELVIVVEHIRGETIPSWLRTRWVAHMMPAARVLHLDLAMPQTPSERPDFWDVWRETLRDLAGPVDVVLASDDYGVRLAAELGAVFVPVDPPRAALATSGTRVRAAPIEEWDMLPRVVRPWYVRRVRLIGADSTGKSTLARALAARFGTVSVPEHAEAYIKGLGRDLVLDDMSAIARIQTADEDALARSARRVLFADSDLVTTTLWSRRLFGTVPDEVLRRRADRRWDLTLVTAPDTPFVPDGHRWYPDERRAFHEAFLEEAGAEPGEVVVIEGDWATREARAVAAVEALLALPQAALEARRSGWPVPASAVPVERLA